jgi:hypothetical protein
MTAPTQEPEKQEEPKEEPSSSPTTEPTKTPSAGPSGAPQPSDQLTAEELRGTLNLYQQTIREQGRELSKLTRQIDEMRTAPPRPQLPPKSVEDEAKEYFTSPRTVIREELKETVKPLVDFVSSFRQENEYEKIKNRLRADPQFKRVLEIGEAYIDQSMQGQPVSEDAVRAVALSVAGAAALGMLPGASITETQPKPKQQGGNVNIPPNIRPSAPPQSPEPKQTVRELTENERRLARENKMSPEEYLAWLEADSIDVATSDIGSKEWKGRLEKGGK